MAHMRAPEDVFQDYLGRRKGILRALTTDVDKFYAQADPERENLCLYGHADGTWEVDLPAEEVPPESPEPALGINFARDGMQRRDWLALVAVHSDTWLIAVAFYNGARLNKEGRERLFELINDLPTCYEVVSGKATSLSGKGKKRAAPLSNPSLKPLNPKSQHPGYSRPNGDPNGSRASRPHPGQQYPHSHHADPHSSGRHDEVDDVDDGYNDGDGDPCPNCGRLYKVGDFWIACDFCDTWYDGKCVQMTPGKAQRMGKWKCPACVRAISADML